METSPLFSIITVCFNSEETIKLTLDSVYNQNCEDYEHLIIDGKSTDSTVCIVQSYKSRKIRLISEADNGIYDAMNKGLSIARGQYVAILNSDDHFANENVLQSVKDKFETSKADIVYSGINFVDSKNEIIAKWCPVEFTRGAYRRGFHTPHPGFFATLKAYKQLGNFDLEMPIAADFDIMLRFMENKSFQSSLLREVTVNMRSDGESSSLKSVRQGLRDIRHSFNKNGTRINIIRYLLSRYVPKVYRKIKTMINNERKL